MLTLFTAMGLIRLSNNRFQITETAREHLVSSSPWYLGPYYASLKDRPVCKDFLQVLRTDKPANWGSFKTEKDWTHAIRESAFAENFTAAMDCRGVYLGQALAKKLDIGGRTRLLDVAGGSGIYACTIAAHFPNLQAAVFEQEPVDQIARQAIEKRGFEQRVGVIKGDMFHDDLPGAFDLHLISNVLHDWNEPMVKELLHKSFAALEPGGMLIIHDVHINADKSGPLPNASYSAMLMHSTEGKCYSISELYPMLLEIGFQNPKTTETAADRSIIMTTKPKNALGVNGIA